MARAAAAKNIRITPDAYYGLAIATALAGESKSAYASRAILEAVTRDLEARGLDPAAVLGEGGGPRRRPRQRPGQPPHGPGPGEGSP